MNPYQTKYRLYLVRIGNNSEEEKESFSKELSERYKVPYALLKKVVDRCPIVLKKNVTRQRAESLAKILKSFGAEVRVEFRKEGLPVLVEFQNVFPQRVSLESCSLRKTSSGFWNIAGRAKNVTDQSLPDLWVFVQLFGDFGEFLTFEEVPFSVNPCPPGETVPFKAIFDGDIRIQKIVIGFKDASGKVVGALDQRVDSEWRTLETCEQDEPVLSVEIGPSRRPAPLEASLPKALSEPCTERAAEPGQREIVEFPVLEVPEKEERDDSFSEVAVAPKEEKESELQTTLSESSSALLSETIRRIEEIGEPSRLPGPVALSESFQSIEEPTDTEGAAAQPVESVSDEGAVSVSPEIPPIDAATFEEAGRAADRISEKPDSGEEAVYSFPWLDAFKTAIDACRHSQLGLYDPFSVWFAARREKNEFKDPFHSILTVLVHARFDQTDGPAKPLENTERVFQLMSDSEIRWDAIPQLEPTRFFSAESWRDLFCRAIPKLQQIAKAILEKRAWEALELFLLIQIIPHMSEASSRKALRWISELVPDTRINFSKMPVSVDEAVYRVASRLGVVDPHFDLNWGPNSIGYLKIQDFSRKVFLEDPSRIELPMTWIARKAEEGGHCLPSEPRCEGCLFEAFCQRLYLHFDPSEKGMGKADRSHSQQGQ